MLIHYFFIGIAHIGASVDEWVGPEGIHLPDGIDHILFLVALVLGSDGRIWSILKTATGFTLGHSLTLALAMLGIVRPPTRLVESAIALSIAYLAAENLLRAKSKYRWWIASAFGLVHGFGFASALQRVEIDGSQMIRALLGFNLGVEMGQIMILLALVPLVCSMKKEPLLTKYALHPCSIGVFAVGAYWLVIRALG